MCIFIMIKLWHGIQLVFQWHLYSCYSDVMFIFISIHKVFNYLYLIFYGPLNENKDLKEKLHFWHLEKCSPGDFLQSQSSLFWVKIVHIVIMWPYFISPASCHLASVESCPPLWYDLSGCFFFNFGFTHNYTEAQEFCQKVRCCQIYFWAYDFKCPSVPSCIPMTQTYTTLDY